jgi:hypothetical protein
VETAEEAVNARLAANHPAAVQRLNEVSELRDMHQTVATTAAADIRAELPGYNLDARGGQFATE